MATSRTFVPPRLEQVEAHLQECSLRTASLWVLWAPLVGLLALILLAGALGPVAAAILPWFGLIALIGYFQWRNWRMRQLERQSLMTAELTILRRYPDALRQTWRLLPRVTTLPHLHASALAVMAQSLEELAEHESALLVLDTLLDLLPQDHPNARSLRITRVMLALHTDQLADADDALRRLRELGEADPPNALSAGYHLAKLYQLVKTRHDEDALSLEESLIDKLRPLGMEAGFGYALMALCYHRLLQKRELTEEQQNELTQRRDLWWQRAKLLLPTERMYQRFEELQKEALGTANQESGA